MAKGCKHTHSHYGMSRHCLAPLYVNGAKLIQAPRLTVVYVAIDIECTGTLVTLVVVYVAMDIECTGTLVIDTHSVVAASSQCIHARTHAHTHTMNILQCE